MAPRVYGESDQIQSWSWRWSKSVNENGPIIGRLKRRTLAIVDRFRALCAVFAPKSAVFTPLMGLTSEICLVVLALEKRCISDLDFVN